MKKKKHQIHFLLSAVINIYKKKICRMVTALLDLNPMNHGVRSIIKKNFVKIEIGEAF
jgi:hypothetical protein